MLSESRFEEIYIACGYTDLRYGIDGLATTVKEKFGLNPIPSFCSVADEATASRPSSGKAMDSCCCTNALKQAHSNGQEKKKTCVI